MSYILLVEDNIQFAEMVFRLLAGAGYQIRHTSRASKALAMVRQEIPALVLLDLELPDMSGETTARILRQQLGIKAPPIVVVSAHDDGPHRQSAKNAGCQAFIAKPVNPEELLHTARYFLEQDWDKSDFTLLKRPGE